MANSFVASRAQLIFALCLPLAVLMGYFLADPTASSSIALIFLVFAVLLTPILMRWYHPLLVFCWNAAIVPYFLPGQPYVWMLLAFIGFGFAVANRFTNPDARFVDIPALNRPLIVITAVILITAWLRGGLGLRSMGSSTYGAKSYFYLLAAITGYFALISQRIPKQRAGLFVAIFFLTGLTALVPNLAYAGGPKMMFLFYLFPPTYAIEQAATPYNLELQFSRIYGLTYASMGLYCWLLARYGLKGIFDLSRPLRLIFFIAATLGCLFCGYRSFLLIFFLTLVSQFYFEGLYRGRSLFIAIGMLLIGGSLVLPHAEKLPLVVQRSLSFLPVEIDPSVRRNADESSDWRVRMWKEVLEQEVPRHLLMGRGYSIDPEALEFAMENSRRGFGQEYGWALVTGTYHNGPLTLLVPLGIWGLMAFLWFIVASLFYLYRHARYGDPDLKRINLFILAFFAARVVYFFGVFGSFSQDLFVFTGLLGLSVSLNGGKMPKKEEAAAEVAETTEQQDLMSGHETLEPTRVGT